MAFDRMKGARQDYAGRAQAVVGDRGMQTGGLARQAGAEAQGVYGEAKARVGDAVDAAGDLYEHSNDYAKRGGQAVATAVNDNPLVSLILASGVGLLVAWS